MIRCLHCGAETRNGLALCELCQRLAASIFDMLPVYFRNLARQRRPGRPNGSLGTSGQWLMRRGESDGSRVNTALERAVNDLDTWARALSDDRDVELPTGDTETDVITATCQLLADHLTSIATLEWAGQFLREIARHERTLRALTESAVPGWYAGACRQVTGRDMEGNTYECGTATFVIPGLTWVTCTGCGTTTYARDHLELILVEARDWLARPKALAEAMVALIDTEQSVPKLHTRIRVWANRGDITPIRRFHRDYVWSDEQSRLIVATQETGHARYWFGEVFDRLLEGDATHGTKAQAS